jgi:hypothetical protein
VSDHSELSPSGWSRWSACPGSREAEAGKPDQTSVYAQWGTDAHAVVEAELNGRKHDCDDDEMLAAVRVCLDYHDEMPGDWERWVEVKLDLSDWIPFGSGTADLVVYDHTDKVLHVIDWKFGKGVRVEASDNGQALLYALGAVREFGYLGEIRGVRVHIVQPRLDHVVTWPPIEFPPMSLAELDEFGEIAKEAAAAAYEPGAPRAPGETQCRFCKAKGDCAEYAALVMGPVIEAAGVDEFADLDSVSAHSLPTPTLSRLLDLRKRVEEWFEALAIEAQSRIESGEKVEGWKLVEANTHRKWGDLRQVLNNLEVLVRNKLIELDDYAPRAPLTPAQMEKRLKKDKVNWDPSPLVVKPEGAPVLAPATDRRPAIAG